MAKADLTAVFVEGMGLGTLGIEPRRAGRWRVVTGRRAVRIGAHGQRWFCASTDRAEIVADRARLVLASNRFATLADAARAVQDVATSLGMMIVTADRIQSHAESVVAKVEQQFESLQRAGELKSVNRGYREYRLAMLAAGARPVGYPTFVKNYKASLVAQAAQHSRLTLHEIENDMPK